MNDMEWNQKVLFLNRLAVEMKNSGHTQMFRKTILTRVIAKYLNSLSNHQDGNKGMYRSRQEREEQKTENKAMEGNDSWFRKGGFTSTLCVPPSPGGRLVGMVEENLRKGRQPTGTKTKVIEGNGLSSCLGLVKSNQFPRRECERGDCVMCIQQGGENNIKTCDKSNVGYEGDCLRCKETKYNYVGETSRTGYTRMKARKKMEIGSPSSNS